MKHLQLFESFIDQLNEIRMDNHWLERTSLPGQTNSSMSRIVPRSSEFPFGYRVVNFIDNKGEEISSSRFFSKVILDPKILFSLLTKSLYSLTRSKRLRDWNPSNEKAFQMMRLGKICFFNGENKFYPIISGGKGSSAEGEYDSGEVVWGFAKEGDLGITIKYYPDTSLGTDNMYKSSRIDSKLSDLQFYKNSEIVYPYGNNFELIIDLTDPDLESIERKINNQVEGLPIELGPQPEKIFVPTEEKEIVRKTISPGEEIGLIVGYVSKELPTLGVISEIINMTEIKDAQKIKSLDSVKEIKVKFIPSDPKNRKFSADGKILAIPITLKDGSIISIKGKSYKILGPTGGKPLITSEPSIINVGNVQTWVESLD